MVEPATEAHPIASGSVLLENGRYRGTCSLYHVCDAYPHGIPRRIYSGEEPHLSVQPDQVGETSGAQFRPGRLADAPSAVRAGSSAT